MNILLIQPQFIRNEKAYPLGLGYLGAVLKQNRHNVFGADLSFVSIPAVFSLIDKENVEIIGISLISYNFKNALLFCRKIKKEKNIPVVAGGPHVTVFKEKLFDNHKDCFDYLIIGEGEGPFLKLVNSIEKGYGYDSVENLIYKKNCSIIINRISNENNNLDDFPVPDRTLFPIFEYKGMVTKDKKYTQIVTSRGCNRRCSYCPEHALWKNWRGRSSERVVDEVKSIVDIFGIKEFHIEDANFFGGGAERVKDFCRNLIESSLDVRWQCPNGISLEDFKDESVLKLMAKSGCYSVSLGIETFDYEILKNMGRFSDFNLARRIIKAAHNAGIEVTGYFMMGFPRQNLSSIITDIYLSNKLDCDCIKYSIFHLIPGAPVYDKYYGKFDFSQIINKNAAISKVSILILKIVRIFSAVLNCLKPRIFLFNLKGLILVARNIHTNSKKHRKR